MQVYCMLVVTFIVPVLLHAAQSKLSPLTHEINAYDVV